MSDNLALCLAVWGLRFFAQSEHSKSSKDISLAAVCLGLSTAVKLPFIVYFALPLGAWMGMPKGMRFAYFKKMGSSRKFIAGSSSCLVCSGHSQLRKQPRSGRHLSQGLGGHRAHIVGEFNLDLARIAVELCGFALFCNQIASLPQMHTKTSSIMHALHSTGSIYNALLFL